MLYSTFISDIINLLEMAGQYFMRMFCNAPLCTIALLLITIYGILSLIEGFPIDGRKNYGEPKP